MSINELADWSPARTFPIIFLSHWAIDVGNSILSAWPLRPSLNIIPGDRGLIDGLFVRQAVAAFAFLMLWVFTCLRLEAMGLPLPWSARAPLTASRIRRVIAFGFAILLIVSVVFLAAVFLGFDPKEVLISFVVG